MIRRSSDPRIPSLSMSVITYMHVLKIWVWIIRARTSAHNYGYSTKKYKRPKIYLCIII